MDTPCDDLNDPVSYEKRVVQIYREDYAADYPSLYTEPWRGKHELNIKNLESILGSFSPRRPDWLDLACGQAWHFSQFAGRANMLGVDLSQPQLLRAQRNAPYATFLRRDMSRMDF